MKWNAVESLRGILKNVHDDIDVKSLKSERLNKMENMREMLDKIIEKYDLIKKTFENFWISYDGYLTDEVTKEESKGYGLTDRNSINAKLSGYSFCVSGGLEFECIKVYIEFFLKGENMPLGRYWSIYEPDGEFFDDYFVIE
ncbi:MAG: hypothetical protein IJ583_07835 [Firmicutes bacterium]|nr:hypothetical protein [Bacillota bacterium]